MRHRIFERGDSTKGAYLGHLPFRMTTFWVSAQFRFNSECMRTRRTDLPLYGVFRAAERYLCDWPVSQWTEHVSLNQVT